MFYEYLSNFKGNVWRKRVSWQCTSLHHLSGKIICVNNFPCSKLTADQHVYSLIAIGQLFFETFDSWRQHESGIRTHRHQRFSSLARFDSPRQLFRFSRRDWEKKEPLGPTLVHYLAKLSKLRLVCHRAKYLSIYLSNTNCTQVAHFEIHLPY